MPSKLRPRLESLEGRLLLSATPAAALPGEVISFLPQGAGMVGTTALANQQAGSVTLTLERNSFGTSLIESPLQVQVATIPPTGLIPSGPPFTSFPAATAGVQYLPIYETVTFPPGVMSEPVTIPLVAGVANPGMLSFGVAASEIGEASAASGLTTATELVYLAETFTPDPQIGAAHMVVKNQRTSDFILQFTQPMDPTSVQNPNSYDMTDLTSHVNALMAHVDGLVGDFDYLLGIHGSSDGLPRQIFFQSATYDPTTNSVDLHLSKSVDSRDTYQIVSGSLTTPLKDEAGIAINGDGTVNGGIFSVMITNKKSLVSD